MGSGGELERYRSNNDTVTRACASDFSASASQPEVSFTNEDDPLLLSSESSGPAFSDFRMHQAILILGYPRLEFTMHLAETQHACVLPQERKMERVSEVGFSIQRRNEHSLLLRWIKLWLQHVRQVVSQTYSCVPLG